MKSPSLKPLDELTDDWEIEEHSDSQIELQAKSGGQANGTNYLTFEKM